MNETDCIEALASLAQLTRLRAFKLLIKREPNGIAAGDLARLIGVPQNTLSSHLSKLSSAGLVEGERRSRSIVYRVRMNAFADLLAFLARDCCRGQPDACAPLLAALAPRPSGKRKASPKRKVKAGCC